MTHSPAVMTTGRLLLLGLTAIAAAATGSVWAYGLAAGVWVGLWLRGLGALLR